MRKTCFDHSNFVFLQHPTTGGNAAVARRQIVAGEELLLFFGPAAWPYDRAICKENAARD